VAGSFEHGNEPSVSKKKKKKREREKFLEQLSDQLLIKKDSALRS